MTDPLVLPPIPVPLQGETPAEFNDRMRNWYWMSDIALRTDCQARKAAWMASIEPNVGPTLTRIADAWDAFDGRLGDLASALNSQPTSDGITFANLMEFGRLLLDKPANGGPGTTT